MKIVDRLTKRRAGLSWHSTFPELDTRGSSVRYRGDRSGGAGWAIGFGEPVRTQEERTPSDSKSDSQLSAKILRLLANTRLIARVIFSGLRRGNVFGWRGYSL